MNGGGGRRMARSSGRKDRDEDLTLFKELHKHEKDRTNTLLQPVSSDFETNGNALYRIASGRKGSSAFELFPENHDKNDYDWLKTPPATPLFPSLEMETNAPELVLQREIPIIKLPSRFGTGNHSEASRGSSSTPKTQNPKPKIPSRSITPSQRPTIHSSNNVSNIKQHLTQKKTNPITESMTKSTANNDFLTSNLLKNTTKDSTKAKPRSRGVSPSVRSTIPAQIPGFSNETPPNLRTDRSLSATRGRPANPTATRRQSVSPSVTRGRQSADQPKQETEANFTFNLKAGKPQTQILGSRMVEKVMNARKLGNAEERENKLKLRGSVSEVSHGFGRLNVTRSSLDTANKRTESRSRKPTDGTTVFHKHA